MRVTEDRYRQRNKEIGAIIARARKLGGQTVSDCAAALKTTRRRYAAIERGDAVINVLELQILMDYLAIAECLVCDDREAANEPTVDVEAWPGETVHVRFKLRP